MLVLYPYPSSFFQKAKVDEDYETEYEACADTGLFEIVLFSYEAWFHESHLVLTRIPMQETEAVYRGWMMKPEQYAAFYHALAENNIRLITTPEASVPCSLAYA